MNESYFAIATLTGIDASLSVAVSIGTQQLEDLKRFREEDIDSDDSPEMIEWMRQEMGIGASQAEKGEFSTLSLYEIKDQVLLQHQQNLS